jgi:hypothetical protein
MPHTPPRRLLLLVPALVLLLAGCGTSAPAATGSDSGTDAPAATEDAAQGASEPPAAGLSTACQLLTQKEAEAIVGVTLSPGAEGDPGDPSCTYQPDPNARTAQVMVTTGDGAKNTYDVDVGLDHEFADVPGIGDEAHQEDYAVFFRKGSTWAGISVVALDDDPALAQRMQDAAKTVVSRLP